MCTGFNRTANAPKPDYPQSTRTLGPLVQACFPTVHSSVITVNIEFANAGIQALNKLQRKRLSVNTTKIEDPTERKKLKRAARKKAAPKAKRTTPRGSNKRKVKKLARGQSKR